MSFEGYYQRLCKNGHAMHADVYIANDDDCCEVCGERVAWQNLVNQTNDDGHPVRLEVAHHRKCGECQSTLEVRYHIPRSKADEHE